MSNPDKSIDIYERLAAAQEALPHGFPRTKSGVEIKLIKMAFSPEEVALAGQLTRFPETAAEIAKRVGMDEADVTVLLESLIPRRLVRLDSPGHALPGVTLRSRARGSTGWARSWLAGTKPICGCWARNLPSSSSNT